MVFDQGAPEEFREYRKRNYGPTIAVYRFTEADPQRTAALDSTRPSSTS